MTTHKYDPLDLYAELAADLFAARRRAKAVGGSNNLRAKGDGPEQAVRHLIQSQIGSSYRVTHGHVVRADGRKSKQIDVIVVKDLPSATMAKTGGVELVRAEWAAAVGEVKASWVSHSEVLGSYQQLCEDISELQQGIREENALRFGNLQNATMADVARPITGRRWQNNCYAFMATLGMGRHDARQIRDALEKRVTCSEDKSVVVLDEDSGGLLLTPGGLTQGEQGRQFKYGVDADIYSQDEELDKNRAWYGIDIEGKPRTVAGLVLGRFLTDIQLHLSCWYECQRSARPYSDPPDGYARVLRAKTVGHR